MTRALCNTVLCLHVYSMREARCKPLPTAVVNAYCDTQLMHMYMQSTICCTRIWNDLACYIRRTPQPRRWYTLVYCGLVDVYSIHSIRKPHIEYTTAVFCGRNSILEA
jgi:hypothetical protein